MSLRVVLIGDPLSGKSTIAAHIGQQLAKLRHQSNPWAVLTLPTTAYAPYSIDVRRTRTLNGVLQRVKNADAPLIIDDRTELYALILESWRAQTAEHRDRLDLPRKARLTPDEWQAVNGLSRSVDRAAQGASVDLVEIHRRGAGVYVQDSDLGAMEGEGVKPKGQAEAGSGGDLVCLLDGGLKARYRETGSRVLRVISDISGRLVGRDLGLPKITAKEDRARLDRDLGKFLKPSLQDLMEWSDSEARAWTAASEADQPDYFSEAHEAAQRAEGELLVSQIKALIQLNDLGGQSADVKGRRIRLLYDHFGVSDVDALHEIPVSRVRETLPRFESSLRGAPVGVPS